MDYIKLDYLDYPQIVTHPMDLNTIKTNLDSNTYRDDPSRCLADFILLWDNTYKFFPPGTHMSEIAVNLQHQFIQMLSSSKLFSEREIAAAEDSSPEKYHKHQSLYKTLLFFSCSF